MRALWSGERLNAFWASGVPYLRDLSSRAFSFSTRRNSLRTWAILPASRSALQRSISASTPVSSRHGAEPNRGAAGDQGSADPSDSLVSALVVQACEPYWRPWLSVIQDCAPRTTGWTACARAGYRLPMRRNVYDPLEPTKEPRWYAVRNMYGAVLEARQLPAGADLKRAFVSAMLEWIDAGWQLGEFSSRTGTFFCTKGVERRMVGITPTDPAVPRSSTPRTFRKATVETTDASAWAIPARHPESSRPPTADASPRTGWACRGTPVE
jgi:hypothetical protein